MTEKPNNKKKPSTTDSGSQGSGGKTAIIITSLIFGLALGFFVFYFFFGGREAAGKKTPQDMDYSTREVETREDKLMEKAIELVKQLKGKHTTLAADSLLDFYKKKLETDNKSTVLVEGWRVQPVQGKDEKNRYYDVYCDWRVDGEKVTYIWTVDLKENKVEPVNEHAQKIEEYDEVIYKSIGFTVTDTADEAAGTKPGDEKEGGISLQPLKAEDAEMDILPPADIRSESPDYVEPISRDPGTPPIPIEPLFLGSDIELKGVVVSGGRRRALIMDGSTSKDVEVGNSLSGGWEVSSISERAITIRKGDDTRTISLMETVSTPAAPPFQQAPVYRTPQQTQSQGSTTSYPQAGQFQGDGNYPRAGTYSAPSLPDSHGHDVMNMPSSPRRSGPPPIPEPLSGDGPPIPPAPGEGGGEGGGGSSIPGVHQEAPIIIPLD